MCLLSFCLVLALKIFCKSVQNFVRNTKEIVVSKVYWVLQGQTMSVLAYVYVFNLGNLPTETP